MRILFLSPGGTYPFRIGGPSIVAYNLVKEFDKTGVEVHFVFGISSLQLSQNHNISNFFRFSENVKLIPIVKSERSPKSYKTSLDTRFLRDTYTLSKKLSDKFDLIHFHSIPNTRDIFVPFLSKLRNIPTILRVSGWINYETFAEKRYEPRTLVYYDYFSLQFLKRFFTKIVCSSSFLKRKLVSDGLFKTEKIEVIPNGLDNERFRNAKKINLEGDPALLFVGRLEYIKGIDILVKTMSRITKELPNAVLHIVGDGAMSNQLKSTVVSCGLGKNIVFHGRITQNLPLFYKAVDICIFPSRFEAFGNMILEAMGAGKPIVASNRGGIPEIIEDFENGILVEPNEDELLKSVVTLWNDKGLLNRMCRNNLRKIQSFDWRKIAKRYIQLYESLSGSTI